jgi:hypothetical protein
VTSHDATARTGVNRDVGADADHYAQREKAGEAKKVESFEGGNTVVIAVSGGTILLVAILLVLLL